MDNNSRHQKKSPIVEDKSLYMACDTSDFLILARSNKANIMGLGVFIITILFLSVTYLFFTIFPTTSMFQSKGIIDQIFKYLILLIFGLFLLIGIPSLIFMALHYLFVAYSITFSCQSQKMQIQRSILGKKKVREVEFTDIERVVFRKEENRKCYIEIQLFSGENISIVSCNEWNENDYAEIVGWSNCINNIIFGFSAKEQEYRGIVSDPYAKLKLLHFFSEETPIISLYDIKITQRNETQLTSEIRLGWGEKLAGLFALVILPLIPLYFIFIADSFQFNLFSLIFWGTYGIAGIIIYPTLIDSFTYSGKVELDFVSKKIIYSGRSWISSHQSTFSFDDIMDLTSEYGSKDHSFEMSLKLWNSKTIPLYRSHVPKNNFYEDQILIELRKKLLISTQ